MPARRPFFEGQCFCKHALFSMHATFSPPAFSDLFVGPFTSPWGLEPVEINSVRGPRNSCRDFRCWELLFFYLLPSQSLRVSCCRLFPHHVGRCSRVGHPSSKSFELLCLFLCWPFTFFFLHLRYIFFLLSLFSAVFSLPFFLQGNVC